MKKRKYTKLIAGLLCAAMLSADLMPLGRLSLAAEAVEIPGTEMQTQSTEATESDMETEGSAQEETISEDAGVTETDTENITQTESTPEHAEPLETETDETTSISETETQEEETQVVLDADGNIASGVIDEDYGHITWVIDADGILTVEGTGDFRYAAWLEYRNEIKYAKINVTDMTNTARMFYDCYNMTTVDLRGLDTSNVTRMDRMFHGCTSLTNLDLSNFNTSNVTSMGGMFYGCTSLSSLDLSNFNTSNVTNMSDMFYRCNLLSSLDLSNFSTSNVTNMSDTFSGCNLLSELNITSFNTSSVTDMKGMFCNCRSLTSLNVSSFNTSNVTDMTSMFAFCCSLTNLDLSSFDTSNVTCMYQMFYYCQNLVSLDLSNFNTSAVGDNLSMGGMFWGCSALTNLNLSNFNTSNVTYMACMFYDCTSLTTLNVSSFNTSNIADMSDMFHGCSSLTSLDLSSFSVAKKEYCSTFTTNMFSGCTSLTSLDLSSFDTSNISSIGIFDLKDCTNLSTIYTPYNLYDSINLPTTATTDIWYRSDGTVVTELPTNLPYSVALGKNHIPKEKEPEKDPGKDPESPADVIELTEDECAILIYDAATKAPIENAQVTIDTATYTTTAKGIASVKASDTPTQKEIKVTATDYDDVSTYQLVKNKTSVRIGMNPVSDELKIVSITGLVGKKNYDFLRSKAVLGYYTELSELQNVTTDSIILNLKTNKSGVTYELFADNQKLLESNDGTFTIPILTKGTTKDGDTISANMPLTDFIEPGQKLSVKATAQDGSSVAAKLNLSTTHQYLTEEITKQKGSFSFGTKIKITAPKDMPFFGGSEVNLGFDEKFPLEIEIDEDGKVRLAYNKPTDTTMEDFGKKYMVWEKKYKGIEKKALRQLGKFTKFDAGMITVSGKVCGYGEGNIKEIMSGNPTIKLGIMAEIEGKAGYKHYWVLAIPVKIFVEGTATGSASIEGQAKFENWKMKELDLSGGSLNVKIEVEAGAGVGLTEYIYELEVSLTGSANYVAKPVRNYQKLWVEGSGKVQRTALYFWEKDLWNSRTYKYTLFQKGTDTERPLPLTDNDTALEHNEPQLMSRSYLNYASGYSKLGQTVALLAAFPDAQSESTVIKSAVLPSTIPALVEADGTKYLFWADDVPSRDDYNRTALFYAKSSDGTNWSSPKRLLPETQDNTPDFYHNVFVSNRKIYIVWQDGTRQLSEKDSLTDLLNSMSIRYAVLDTAADTITDGGQLTKDTGCYLYPCTVTTGKQTYFAYVHNLLDSGSIDGTNTQTLCLIMPDKTTKEIVLPAKSQIADMNAGIFNGKPSLVCTVDTDGDAATDNDMEIYLCGFEDASLVRVTDNQATDVYPVIADSGNLYWCQDQTIMKLSDSQENPVPIWSETQLAYQTAFTVATDKNGKDTILWEAVDASTPDGSVSIFQTSEGSSGAWSDITQFAKTSGTIASKISAAGSSSSLQVAHTQGIYLEDDTRLKDLCVTARETMTDIALEYVDFDEEQASAGSALTLKAGVTNNGNTTINSLEAVISGNTVTTLTGLNLKPSENRELTITGFRVPSDLNKSTPFTLTLTASNEKNLDDNTADFTLGCPDVSVEASHRMEEGKTQLDINIYNNASYEASGTIVVHKGHEDGEVIFSKEYSSLNAQNGYSYSVDLGDYEDSFTNYYVVVTSDTEENNIGDNTEFVYIGYGTGVEQEDQTQETYEITSISLNRQNLSLEIGNTAQLSVKDNQGNTINASELLWSSDDKRIAGVEQNGLITAYRTGTTQVTAYYGDLSSSCTVTVAGASDDKHFTVSFDTQGGEQLASVTNLMPGSVITLPSDVIREGYLFEGWYTQPEGGVKVESSAYTVTETVTLYAHWKPISEDTDTEHQGDGLWISGVSKTGYLYTGEAIIPAVTVWDKDTPLIEKKDYTIVYKNNKSVGKATITVTGKGNYSGKETFSFDITPADIEHDIYADSFYVKTNAKKVQKPVPELYYMGTKLKNNKDFTITYSNKSGIYAQQGEYIVTVTGKNNYTGSKTLTLTAVSQIPKKKPISITKADLTGFETSFTYTGTACRQTCTLKLQVNGSEKTLVEGADYTVHYANNSKAGTATVTYYGKNGYAGKLKKTYKILPYNIAANETQKITYDNTFQCVYAKGGAKPKPVITFDSAPLREGVDYTLNYKNNKTTGSSNASCVILKNFQGTITIPFTIEPQDLSKMTLVSSDKVYNGKAGAHKLTPKLMDLDGTLLSAGKDFDKRSITYTYENDTNLEDGKLKKAGTLVENTDIIPADTQIRITLNHGSGNNYTGTFTGTYRIVKADIKSAKVKIPTQIYTGTAIIPDKDQITVTLAGTPLRDEDYDIILCTNNVKKGKASLTISGKGNYGGTKTVKFTIGAKGFLWWWRKS